MRWLGSQACHCPDRRPRIPSLSINNVQHQVDAPYSTLQSILPAASRRGLIRSGILGVKRFIEISLRVCAKSESRSVSTNYCVRASRPKGQTPQVYVDKDVDNSRAPAPLLILALIPPLDTIV